MPKNRTAIPKPISEQVLKEYRHKCAICGRSEPQLHHLDEDPSNHDVLNLLPLCPNCHLQDTHDPTSPPDPRKLRLFRKYKDPLILDPRFHPIFVRLIVFRNEALLNKRPQLFNHQATAFLTFVESFEKGAFYGKEMLEMLRDDVVHYKIARIMDGATDEQLDNEEKNDPQFLAKTWQYAVDSVEAMTVELLRYQDWKSVRK